MYRSKGISETVAVAGAASKFGNTVVGAPPAVTVKGMTVCVWPMTIEVPLALVLCMLLDIEVTWARAKLSAAVVCPASNPCVCSDALAMIPVFAEGCE